MYIIYGGKKERRDYYLIKTYDVLCVTNQKFSIYKKTNKDMKT